MPSETKCIQTPKIFTPYNWNQSFTEASESPSKQPPTTSFPSESAFPGADAAPENKSWEVIQSSQHARFFNAQAFWAFRNQRFGTFYVSS
jgi:hypothetical protein